MFYLPTEEEALLMQQQRRFGGTGVPPAAQGQREQAMYGAALPVAPTQRVPPPQSTRDQSLQGVPLAVGATTRGAPIPSSKPKPAPLKVQRGGSTAKPAPVPMSKPSEASAMAGGFPTDREDAIGAANAQRREGAAMAGPFSSAQDASASDEALRGSSGEDTPAGGNGWSKFGDFMRNNDIGGLIRNIGLGLSRNPGRPGAGLAEGVQGYSQERYRDYVTQQRQNNVDRDDARQEKRDASQDEYRDATLEADQRDYEHGIEREGVKDDQWQQDWERDGQTLEFNRRLAEARAQADITQSKASAANSYASAARYKKGDPLGDDLTRAQIEATQALRDQRQSKAGGGIDDPDTPKDESEAGLTLGERSIIARSEDKYFTDRLNEADAARQNRAFIADAKKRVQDNPGLVLGPDIISSSLRGVQQVLGTQDYSGLKRLASNSELWAAQSQKGLGQLTEPEREIIRKSIVSPESLTREEFLAAADAMDKVEADRTALIDDWYDETKDRDPDKVPESRGFRKYATQRRSKRASTPEGNSLSTSKEAASPLYEAPKGASGTTKSGLKWKIEE